MAKNNGFLMALFGLALGLLFVGALVIFMGMQQPASLVGGNSGNFITDIQVLLEPTLIFFGPAMLIIGLVAFMMVAPSKTIARQRTLYWILVGVTFLAIVVGLILSLDLVQSLILT